MVFEGERRSHTENHWVITTTTRDFMGKNYQNNMRVNRHNITRAESSLSTSKGIQTAFKHPSTTHKKKRQGCRSQFRSKHLSLLILNEPCLCHAGPSSVLSLSVIRQPSWISAAGSCLCVSGVSSCSGAFSCSGVSCLCALCFSSPSSPVSAGCLQSAV